jgi:hypothetical protein
MAAPNRAQAFFDTHVLPAVDEWRKYPDDIRLAMNAAVALNQMADHYWHAFAAGEPDRVLRTTSVQAFRGELGKQQPDWALVRDVAEAHKHVKLDRPSRVLTSAGQTTVAPTAYGRTGYGTGPYGGTPSVVVQLDSGTSVHFSSAVAAAVSMWRSFLA